MPHVGGTSESGNSTNSDSRRVRIGIHLQCGTDKAINRILSCKLTQNAVRTEALIPSGKVEVRARCDVVIHSNYASETMNAMHPATFDASDHCRVGIQRPVFGDVSSDF